MNDSNQHSQNKVPKTNDSKIKQVVSEVWDEAMLEARSHQSHHTLPSKEWFSRLPSINQLLLGAGGICIAAGLFFLIGVPVLGAAKNSAQVAIHPYTAAGKREACLSNLQRIGEALNQYRQDYDGKYPPAEYTANGRRVTWMTLLRERGLDADTFKCPANRSTRGDDETTGGYAFNPVFYGKVLGEYEGNNIAKMIVIAERSSLHDSSLLPPFSFWNKKPSSDVSPEEATNLSPNHSGNSVAVLYADSHVDTQAAGSWMTDGVTWGGEILRDAGLHRLETQNPLLTKIQSQTAASFRNQKQKLHQSLNQLYLLQKETQGYRFIGDATEERLWRGAYYLNTLGDPSFEKQLNNDLHKHSHDLFAEVGTNWQKHQGEFGFSMEYPGTWQTDQQIDGRYRTTYFRSESPHALVAVELGERTTPTYATVIDWTGMENVQKARYGKHYKRIAIGSTSIGGHYASTWDFEVRRPNAPKVRKRYIGYSTMWSSVIISNTAPAAEWKDWQGSFAHMADSFEMSN